MTQQVETDIVIMGGGVAGLWLLHRLRAQGFSVILFESGTLGGGQTHKAQGIIHGGLKYALQGLLTSATRAISDMPTVWKHCLQGDGEIDLSAVPILSAQQYLWSTGSLTSKLASFFAGLALKGNVQSLQKGLFPAFFQHPQFKGHVYSLDEMVIDTHALVRELAKPHQDVIFKIDPMQENHLKFDNTGRLVSLNVEAIPFQTLSIKAQKYIFTAGNGNAIFVEKLKNKECLMQKRPLHMVVVKHSFSSPLYAHCLGLDATPRITITTHVAQDGKWIWYLGGQIAEEGVKRTPDEQIQFAQKELQELFPWLDLSDAQFATFFVDRAESLQADGKRPDSYSVKEIENTIIAWPTKLALVPLLAEDIVQRLMHSGLKPGECNLRELRTWPIPRFARPIWDQLL